MSSSVCFNGNTRLKPDLIRIRTRLIVPSRCLRHSYDSVGTIELLQLFDRRTISNGTRLRTLSRTRTRELSPGRQ